LELVFELVSEQVLASVLEWESGLAWAAVDLAVPK
jgi:hypothetical protein